MRVISITWSRNFDYMFSRGWKELRKSIQNPVYIQPLGVTVLEFQKGVLFLEN